MAPLAKKLQLEVFGFLPTIYVEINTNKMHHQSLHATRVYLHAQTPVDADDIRN